MQLDVNREELLELAANKLANEYVDEDSLSEKVRRKVDDKLDSLFKDRIEGLIDQALSNRLETVMQQTITPVDIFGDRKGEPTTIREVLSDRAKEFWNTQVTEDGKVPKERNYYSSQKLKTRAEWMLGKVVSETFADEVKANATAILTEFREQLRKDLHANVDKHLDGMVNTKKRR